LIFRWLVILKARLAGIALSKDGQPSFPIDIGTHDDEFLSFWKFKIQDATQLPIQLIFRWLVISKARLAGIALSKDGQPSFLIDIGTHDDEFLSFWKFKIQDATQLPIYRLPLPRRLRQLFFLNNANL
jgi:hypothetical protein